MVFLSHCVDSLQIVLPDGLFLCIRHAVVLHSQLLDGAFIVVHLPLGGLRRGVHLTHHLHKLLHTCAILTQSLL